MPTPVIKADFKKSRLDFILYVLFEELLYFLVWLLIITVILSIQPSNDNCLSLKKEKDAINFSD